MPAEYFANKYCTVQDSACGAEKPLSVLYCQTRHQLIVLGVQRRCFPTALKCPVQQGQSLGNERGCPVVLAFLSNWGTCSRWLTLGPGRGGETTTIITIVAASRSATSVLQYYTKQDGLCRAFHVP